MKAGVNFMDLRQDMNVKLRVPLLQGRQMDYPNDCNHTSYSGDVPKGTVFKVSVKLADSAYLESTETFPEIYMLHLSRAEVPLLMSKG